MNLFNLYKQYQFVFTELVKRDFKKKYKRSVLGMLWSMLAPLFTLLVMNFIFGHFFGRTQEYYTIYLFSGWLIFQYYSEATNGAMNSLMANAGIFSKVKVPKYLFLFSRITSSSINFFLVLIVYFIFVIAYGLPITWKFVTLLYPIVCMFILILGVGLILSALFVFFRDIQYIYSVITTAWMYLTPIFYNIEILPDWLAPFVMYCNPMYSYLMQFRCVTLYNKLPSLQICLAGIIYAFAALIIGGWSFLKTKNNFILYI